jgi:hypothetical protein
MGAAALIGAFYFKKFQKSFRILSLYLIYAFLQQILAIWSGRTFETNTAIAHLYVIISVLSYCALLISFGVNGLTRKILVFSTVVILVLIVLSILFVQKIDAYPTFNLGLNGLYVTFTSLLFFSYIMDNPSDIDVLKDSRFLIASIFLLFFMPSLFIYPVLNYVAEHIGEETFYTNLIYVLNFIFYSLLSLVLWKEKNTRRAVLND